LCSESTSSVGKAKGKAGPTDRAANKAVSAPTTKRRRAAKSVSKIAAQKSACHEDESDMPPAQMIAPASPIFDDDDDSMELQVKRLCSGLRATEQEEESSKTDNSATASLVSLSPPSVPLPQQRQLLPHQALPLPPPLPAPPLPSLLHALPYPTAPIAPAPLYPGIGAGLQSTSDSCYRFGQPAHWQIPAVLQPPPALSGVGAAYGLDLHAHYRALQQQQQFEHARQQTMFAQLLCMQRLEQSRAATFLQGSLE